MNNSGKSILKFITPSVCKEESLPSANGKMGVLVYGGAKRDTIRFCHAGLCETKCVYDKQSLCNFVCDKKCDCCKCGEDCPFLCGKNNGKGKVANSTTVSGEGQGEYHSVGQGCDEFPDVTKEFEEMKILVAKGEYVKAQNLMVDKILSLGKRSFEKRPIAVCNLEFDFEVECSIDDYYRALDMDSGEIKVFFEDKKGVVERNMFVSSKTGLFMCYISASKGKKVNFSFWISNAKQYDEKDEIDVVDNVMTYTAYAPDGQKMGIVLKFCLNGGSFELHGKKISVKGADEVDIFAKTFVCEKLEKNNHTLKENLKESLKGSLKENLIENLKESDKKQDNDIKESIEAKESIDIKGDFDKKKDTDIKENIFSIVDDQNVENVDVNYDKKQNSEINESPCFNKYAEQSLFDTQKLVSRAKGRYDSAILEQKEIFQSKMNFPQVELGDGEVDSVEKMIFLARRGEIIPDLIEKLCKFGNYLFAISSSSLFDFPSGVFDLCFGQTNHYLQVENLMFPCFFGGDVSAEVFFDKYFDRISVYETLCKKMFGFDGIFVPSLQDDKGYPSYIEGQNLHNNNVAGLICFFVYKHYLKTNDQNFLKKANDFLTKTGDFYANFFVENVQAKTLESPFGISPYSRPKGEVFYLSPNPMVDFATAKGLFKILVEVCHILGQQEQAEKFERLLSLVPDVQVDNSGLIKEYNLNGLLTDESSPFISHLVPYCVGAKRFEAKKDFEALVANSIKSRYLNSTGKYRSNDLCRMALGLFACGESADGYEILKTLIKNFLSNNLLFSLYDNLGFGMGLIGNKNDLPFDTNIMLFSCIKNMFVKSCKSDIFLFDSFPQELKRCSIKSVILDGGVMCDMWVTSRGMIRLHLRSKGDTSVNVYMPRGTKKVKVRGALFDYHQNAILGLELRKNKKKKIKVYFEG
ncbi:MAG: glycoside hydrolase N-terminal domain-containing protein [Christensenellales bacterium]